MYYWCLFVQYHRIYPSWRWCPYESKLTDSGLIRSSTVTRVFLSDILLWEGLAVVRFGWGQQRRSPRIWWRSSDAERSGHRCCCPLQKFAENLKRRRLSFLRQVSHISRIITDVTLCLSGLNKHLTSLFIHVLDNISFLDLRVNAEWDGSEGEITQY